MILPLLIYIKVKQSYARNTTWTLNHDNFLLQDLFSNELEEIFPKPLLEKLLQKYSQPLHAFANHNEPIEPLTLDNMFKGQPWTPVPNPECGNS